MEKLDDILNSIEENCSPRDYEVAIIPFMLRCADLVAERLPEVARESLRTAKAFASRELQAVALEHAQSLCWAKVGNGPDSLRFDNPELAGVRAMICILQKQLHAEAYDFVELLGLYLELLNAVESHVEEQRALLHEIFSACL